MMGSGRSDGGGDSGRATSGVLLESLGYFMNIKGSGMASSSGTYHPLLSGLGHRHTESSHGSLSDCASTRRSTADLGSSSGKDGPWQEQQDSPDSDYGHSGRDQGAFSRSSSRSILALAGKLRDRLGVSALLCVQALKVALLLALVARLGGLMVQGFCTSNPASCTAMPMWLKGQTWISLNDTSSVAMGKVSVFDSFLADYKCTARASRHGHEPSFLFDTVKVLDERPLSNFPKQPPAPGGSLDLLVGILSGCTSVGLRNAVRETWQRLDPGNHGMTWRAVFIVGNCPDMLEKEQEQFGDLLFTSPKDTYYALTAKVLDFFDYAASVGSRFVMKTDDDTFVFIDRILRELKEMRPQCLYWGSNHMGRVPSYDDVYNRDPTQPRHVLSIPTVKWYIPEPDFKLIEDTWYMAGGAYIMSSDMVQQIVTRTQTVPSHLPEDATMGALLGSAAVQACKCADSRHVKDVQEFQHIRLFKNNGGQPEALPCEISNVVYRTLTIHGMRNPALHHEVLRVASSPRDVCKGKASPSDERGIQLTDAESYWEQIWGRKLPRMGEHSIYMQGEAYNNMVGCKKCKKDRPVPYTLLIKKVNQWGLQSNPSGFDKAFHNMAVNRTVPNVLNLLPISRMLEPKVDLPWCVKLDWATQLSDQLIDLDKKRFVLCDLSLKRVYIDITRFKPIISAGRSQWTYSYRRFHSGAWCFADEQCQACLKASPKDTMDWLPESKCNKETNRCPGFDGDSLTVALVRNVLRPMLMPGAKGDMGKKVMNLFKGIVEAKRDLSRIVPENKQVLALNKGLQSVRGHSSMRRCLKNQAANMRMTVHWVNRQRKRGLYTNYWGMPTDLE